MNFWASVMEAFEYSALPARVIFGFGTLPRAADELLALGCKRAFVLSDPHHAAAGAARLMHALDRLGVHLSTDAVMHTPVDVTERVLAKLIACDADCLISLGGGSTIGLGKALALRTDLDARSDALFGAWACGSWLGAVGMSLHHKLCHVLGGTFGLPHAETHTVILPHAAAYNAGAAPAALDRVARALGAHEAAGALFDLAAKHGAPTSLRQIGMSESDLDKAADVAMQSAYWNPRPLERGPIRALLDDAYHGRRPSRTGV